MLEDLLALANSVCLIALSSGIYQRESTAEHSTERHITAQHRTARQGTTPQGTAPHGAALRR